MGGARWGGARRLAAGPGGSVRGGVERRGAGRGAARPRGPGPRGRAGRRGAARGCRKGWRRRTPAATAAALGQQTNRDKSPSGRTKGDFPTPGPTAARKIVAGRGRAGRGPRAAAFSPRPGSEEYSGDEPWRARCPRRVGAAAPRAPTGSGPPRVRGCRGGEAAKGASQPVKLQSQGRLRLPRREKHAPPCPQLVAGASRYDRYRTGGTGAGVEERGGGGR